MSNKFTQLFASVASCAIAAAAHAQIIATGPSSLGGPQVQKFFEPGGQPLASFFAYSATFTGGVRVALGDLNGDGVPDIITAPGPGGAPQVKAFDGVTGATIRDFLAFSPTFAGGVYVASGNISSAAHADIVVAAGSGGGPQVIIFDGVSGAIVRSFFAFPAGFSGGLRVAVGDVSGDGVGDIIVATGPGAAPEVKVFDGATGGLIRDFFAYANTYTGGVFVAAGDINGDGTVEIITGTDELPGSGPQVKVFNGQTSALITSFFAFAPTFAGGVRVATCDVNGDGVADIITSAGPGGAPQVSCFSGTTGALLRTFNAYTPTFTGGVFVAGGRCSPQPCPPPNNECPAAVVVTLGSPIIGTNTGATPSVTLTNNPSNVYCNQATWSAGAQKDAFFQFTPTTSGLYAIDTCGSSFDTILAVHSGCPITAANMIGCNDDSNSGFGNVPCANSFNSRIPVIQLTAAQPYTLRVFGYGGATGTIVLTVNSVSGAGACCTGSHCSTTTLSTCPGTYLGLNTTCGPANNPTTCCPANFNAVNGLNVQDIFDFLTAWFAGMPAADFNHVNGLSVQDIFDFLGAWFAGC